MRRIWIHQPGGRRRDARGGIGRWHRSRVSCLVSRVRLQSCRPAGCCRRCGHCRSKPCGCRPRRSTCSPDSALGQWRICCGCRGPASPPASDHRCYCGWIGLGAAPEMLIPHRPSPRFEAALDLDVPTDRRADLDWVLDDLIDRVTAKLTAHGRGAIRVRVGSAVGWMSSGSRSACIARPTWPSRCGSWSACTAIDSRCRGRWTACGFGPIRRSVFGRGKRNCFPIRMRPWAVTFRS